MRALPFTLILATLILVAIAAPAPAQTPEKSPAAATTKPARGGDIKRDEYIERAVERARKSAAARFDKMDANHDGILTVEERRAYRAARRGDAAQ